MEAGQFTVKILFLFTHVAWYDINAHSVVYRDTFVIPGNRYYYNCVAKMLAVDSFLLLLLFFFIFFFFFFFFLSLSPLWMNWYREYKDFISLLSSWNEAFLVVTLWHCVYKKWVSLTSLQLQHCCYCPLECFVCVWTVFFTGMSLLGVFFYKSAQRQRSRVSVCSLFSGEKSLSVLSILMMMNKRQTNTNN